MNNQLNSNTQAQAGKEESFWDDDLNKVIAAGLILILLFLIWRYKPWNLLFPAAEQASSAAVSSAKHGVSSATSAGLSVSEIVSLL
ncbi:MAG: hypothetical protein KDB98_06620 [Flavobacteriales bacterium]|nr:hypothetical protein [Flavobacteriales bacterium]